MCGLGCRCGGCIYLKNRMLEQRLVKPPQSRHGKGRSTVYLCPGGPWGKPDQQLYVKTQEHYNCRPGWRLWQPTPTFACEARALQACHALGMSVPELVSFRSEGDVTELALGDIADAVPLNKFYMIASAGRLHSVMQELGEMVGVMHRAGWVHRALLPGHVLIQPNAQDKVWLIDFEKTRRAFFKRSFESDIERFVRHCHFLKSGYIDSFFSGYGSARPESCQDPVRKPKSLGRSSSKSDTANLI